MAGLDIKRLEAIRLTPKPVLQRVVACSVLMPNYAFLPGVKIEVEGLPDLPPEPVILAANHTDRYNYFPLQYRWWRDLGRYTSAWMKGKYYENPLLAAVMSRMGTLPTVSRGYLVTKDFLAVTGRLPNDEEYRLLRAWVEKGEDRKPERGAVPVEVVGRARNVLGRFFDPFNETYAAAMNALYVLMMEKFTALNEESFKLGRDLLIFPQGTRSKRLLPGRPGLGQAALHFKKTIIPVGINGSDLVYRGNIPLAGKGKVVVRLGAPVTYEELSPFHPGEPFTPFTPEAERAHGASFQGVTDLVTARINDLLDPQYRQDADAQASGPETGVRRFV